MGLEVVIRITLLFLGAVLLLCSPALARVAYGNQRLDHAFYAGHDEKTVLLVEIRNVDRKKSEGHESELGAPDVDVEFRVRTVLRGDSELKGKTLRFYVGNFIWPLPLVPMTAGTRALLILRPDRDQIACLLPAHRDSYKPVESRAAMLRLLARDLMKGLQKCGKEDRERKRVLLLTVGPILTAAEAAPLEQMLRVEDPWLRRAARGAWIHATKDPDAMEIAAKDIASFLDAHADRKAIQHPDGTAGYAPFPLLFDHYFFLEVGWSSEQDRAAVAYRNLFRLVGEHTRHAPFLRWFRSIRPLCRVGGMKDLALLHDEYRARLRGVDRAVRERQDLLLGMGRILGIELSAWVMDQFPDHEPKQYARVRSALKERGILE